MGIKDIGIKVGSVGKKSAVFVGGKIKEGVNYVYENKDEIIGKVSEKVSEGQERAIKQQEKNEKEIERYVSSFESYSSSELMEIVKDTSKKNTERKAAKKILENR